MLFVISINASKHLRALAFHGPHLDREIYLVILLNLVTLTNEKTQNDLIKKYKITQSLEKIMEPLEKEVQEELLKLTRQRVFNLYRTPEEALENFVHHFQLARTELSN